MPTRRALVIPLCLLAGGLVAFAMPPWGWWPSAFAGIALVDQLIAGRPRRSRFWRAAGFGAGWLFPATFWMIDFTPPGYLIVGVLFAAFFGAAAAVAPGDRWRWLGLPAALVLVEALRWRFPFGGVPLATLPMSQVASPLALSVRLLGPLLLAALVVAGGVGVSAATERQWRTAGGILAGIVVIVVVARIAPDGTAIDTIDVAVVQGGGPQNTLAVNTDARDVFERHLEASELIQTPVDLVLWPEDVVHVRGPVEDSELYAPLQDLARRLDTVLIPGVFETIDDTTTRNASIVLGPDGEQISRYDKVRIVPFGEYVPFRSLVEPFAPDYLPRREVERGTGEATVAAPLKGRDVELGVSISWEIFFTDRARDAISNGGELLLNPTNGSSYWLTIVQTQQVASSRLRAMETGRWVLQAAPTGFSAVVEPDGTVVERTGVSEQRVIQATVELREGSTIATRVGLWPMLLLAAGALTLANDRSRRATPHDRPRS